MTTSTVAQAIVLGADTRGSGLALLPDVRVQVAFGTGPDAAVPAWFDITDQVIAETDIQIQRGRSKELDQVEPGTLSLTLANDDGRFTLGSTYFGVDGNGRGQVKPGRRIRAVATYGPSLLPPGPDTSWVSHAGTLAARTDRQGVTLTAAGTGDAYAYSPVGAVPALPGDVFSGRLVVRGPAARSVRAQLSWWAADGSYLSGTQTAFAYPGDGDDLVIEVSATAPAAAASVTLEGLIIAPAAGEAWQLLEAGLWGAQSCPGRHYLFDGYIDTWPTTFDNGSEPIVAISATDRQARIAKRQLRSIVAETLLSPAYWPTTVAYWPLGEGQGATSFGNLAPSGLPVPAMRAEAGTATADCGTVTAGSAAPTNPAAPWNDVISDFGSMVALAPASSSQGYALVADDLTGVLDGSEQWVCFSTWYAGTAPGTLMWVGVEGGAPAVTVEVTTDGKLQATVWGRTASAGYVPLGTGSYNNYYLADGAPHLLTLWIATIGGTPRSVRLGVDDTPEQLGLAIYVNNGGAGNIPVPGDGITSGRLTSFAVGGDPRRHLYAAGSFAHAAIRVAPAAPANWGARTIWTAGNSGFAGALSGARLKTLATLAGVPTSATDFDAGQSSMGAHTHRLAPQLSSGYGATNTTYASSDNSAVPPIAGQSAMEAMDAVATTEMGVVFVDGHGDLAFQDRHHRIGLPVAFTVSAVDDGLGAGLAFAADTSLIYNSVTATRPDGSSVLAVDPSSIADYGVLPATVEQLFVTDDALGDAAAYRLAGYSQPRLIATGLALEPMTCPRLWEPLLGLEISDRFQVTDLPVGAPAETLDLICEHITHTLNMGSGWTTTIETSPADLYYYLKTSAAAQQVTGSDGAVGDGLAAGTTRLALPPSETIVADVPPWAKMDLVDAAGARETVLVTARDTAAHTLTVTRSLHLAAPVKATDTQLTLDADAAAAGVLVGHTICVAFSGNTRDIDGKLCYGGNEGLVGLDGRQILAVGFYLAAQVASISGAVVTLAGPIGGGQNPWPGLVLAPAGNEVAPTWPPASMGGAPAYLEPDGTQPPGGSRYTQGVYSVGLAAAMTGPVTLTEVGADLSELTYLDDAAALDTPQSRAGY